MLQSLEIINAEIETAKQQRENFIEQHKLLGDDASEDVIRLDNRIREFKQIEQVLKEILLLKEILKKHLFVLKEKGISFERMYLILSDYEDKDAFDFLKTYATRIGASNE